MLRQEARNGPNERNEMRHRSLRKSTDHAFEVTRDDYEDARHAEDPADRRGPVDVDQALESESRLIDRRTLLIEQIVR